MDLVGALNRVFEKVLGVKTADSKKLLDDYIGGGGGGDCKVVFADVLVDVETQSMTIDKTAAELIGLIGSGKYIIATVGNSEDDSMFLPLLSHVVEDEHNISFYFLNMNEMTPRAEFFATGLNEKPVHTNGGR